MYTGVCNVLLEFPKISKQYAMFYKQSSPLTVKDVIEVFASKTIQCTCIHMYTGVCNVLLGFPKISKHLLEYAMFYKQSSPLTVKDVIEVLASKTIQCSTCIRFHTHILYYNQQTILWDKNHCNVTLDTFN